MKTIQGSNKEKCEKTSWLQRNWVWTWQVVKDVKVEAITVFENQGDMEAEAFAVIYLTTWGRTL